MATPSFPVFQRGVNFGLLIGNNATPTELFSSLCIATTLDFSRAIQFDDEMVIDCANPQNLPIRLSIAKGQTWDVTFSGKCDFARFQALEANFDGNAHNYQVQKFGTGAQGGGTYQGAAMLESLKMSKNENGMVAFSATLKGQGVLAYTASP